MDTRTAIYMFDDDWDGWVLHSHMITPRYDHAVSNIILDEDLLENCTSDLKF